MVTDRNTDPGDTYAQSGNFGTGSMKDCEINDNATVAGQIINKQYNIAEALTNHKATTNDAVQNRFKKPLGKLIDRIQKYGELVRFELQLFGEEETMNHTNMMVQLTISFAEAEETFSYNSGLLKTIKKVNVRFGVKYGKLYLNFTKGTMPLGKREPFEFEEVKDWQVTPTGADETPIWQFQAKEKQQILKGLCRNKALGIIDLSNNACVLEGIFEVSMVEKDIVITSQDGLWDSQTNKKKKATIRIKFIKDFLKPKLEDYLSKIKLEYDATLNS